MTRKLATIRTIDRIDPIEDADRIEKATIDGWNIIVGKGLHKAGDQVIYLEIDSALPVNDHRLDPDGTLKARGTKKWNGQDCHILKTIRLRGTYSQGLILPISVLDQPTAPADAPIRKIMPYRWLKALKAAQRRTANRDGVDVTKILGITKYDRYEAMKAETPNVPWWKFWVKQGHPDKNIIGPFPTNFAQQSDSPRIQNLTGDRKWAKITSHKWVATEKIDGQSITLINDNGNLRIASRNFEIKKHPARKWALANGFLDYTVHGDATQGEWAGPGIQGNKLDLDENRFFVFASFHKGKPRHRSHWEKTWEVPQLHEGGVIYEMKDPNLILHDVDGMMSTINTTRLAEGIVFHESEGNQLPALGGRSTFKAISNKWLVKAK